MKSKGLSDESIKLLARFDSNLVPSLGYIGVRARVKFNGQCLKQDKVTFSHGKVVNIYIVYEINLWPFKQSDDPLLEYSLLGAVKLVKNVDIDKYKYSGYGIVIRFDTRGSFSLSSGSGFDKNGIIFWADMSSSVHVNNKKKDILILWKGTTDRLDDTTMTAEKEYLINFTE